MKSTDHNIQDPTKINIIDLLNEVSAWHNPTMITCTQNFYDLLQTKDPHTIYIIEDAQFPTVYYGSVKIFYKERKVKYLMTPSNEHPGEYIIFMNQPEGWGDMLWEVCRFDDPQKALNALMIYNKVGSHHEVDIEVYRMILNFINKEITLNNLIIGFFCAFGYKENINLQEVNTAVLNLYHAWCTTETFGEDFPEGLRGNISTFKEIADKKGNYMFSMYQDLYNVVVKFNFFKDDKYHKDEVIDLADVISSITDVLYSDIRHAIYRNLL